MKLRIAQRELIAIGRELWERRLVTGSSGNLSVRLDDDCLLMTRAGISLRALHPEDLVVTDLQGQSSDDRKRPTTEYLLHVAAYRERPDVSVAVHTHPTFCVVWSKYNSVLPRDTVGARETLGDVIVARYQPPGSSALADEVGAAIRSVDNVLMERHGFLSVATSLEEALLQTDLAEEAARIAYFSRLAGLAPTD